MKKLLLSFIFLLQSYPSYGLENKWLILNEDVGCVEFSEEFSEQSLRNAKSPTELLNSLKQKGINAEMVPFVEYLEKDQESKKMTEEERKFFKPFNPSNSFIIYTPKREIEIAVITEELCKEIKGFAD